MSLFDRMKTSVKADAHGVIDALEDRRLLLRQCVRDAEAELGKKRAHLQALELDLRSIERDGARAAQQLAELEADAELALSAGEDALAQPLDDVGHGGWWVSHASRLTLWRTLAARVFWSDQNVGAFSGGRELLSRGCPGGSDGP